MMFSLGDSTDAKRIFTSFIGVFAMSGLSMTTNLSNQENSMLAEAGSLLDELLSGDVERQRIAASFVRANYDMRARARNSGTTIVVVIDGQTVHLEPDSPLLPDLSAMVPIVKELFPLPPDQEPPGFA